MHIEENRFFLYIFILSFCSFFLSYFPTFISFDYFSTGSNTPAKALRDLEDRERRRAHGKQAAMGKRELMESLGYDKDVMQAYDEIREEDRKAQLKAKEGASQQNQQENTQQRAN
eukprot:TRINITY_DN1188_c0_g1_i4.p2 TRINITY_DN1188_c0_g1~~TRINITY_DN1188_c0_g1_i4.p2  ORF type:complete len:115 (+),score=28.94 TRINITY_DN1188_c0_g1_i4:89-433(+)